MEEKILIETKPYNWRKVFKIIKIIMLTIAIITLLVLFFDCFRTVYFNSYGHWKYWSTGGYTEKKTIFIFADFIPAALITLATIGIVLFFIYLIFKCFDNVKLTITDKRAYGVTAFKKRVDLPLDSISAVGVAILKSIAITTASGAIKFIGIDNRDEIFDTMSKLLIERQNASKVSVTQFDNKKTSSNADELKKYKELLDEGVITQEEFEAKKKELLGL